MANFFLQRHASRQWADLLAAVAALDVLVIDHHLLVFFAIYFSNKDFLAPKYLIIRFYS